MGPLDATGVYSGYVCPPSARVRTVKMIDEAIAKKLGHTLKTLLH